MMGERFWPHRVRVPATPLHLIPLELPNLLFTYVTPSAMELCNLWGQCLAYILFPQPSALSVWQMSVVWMDGIATRPFPELLPRFSSRGIFPFPLSVHTVIFSFFSLALSLSFIPLNAQNMLSTWPCLEFWKYKGKVGNSFTYTHQTSQLTCTCTWWPLDLMPGLPVVLWIPWTMHWNHLGSFNNGRCLGPDSENQMPLLSGAGWAWRF